MALRPRLSPGVPLSWDGEAELLAGTAPVKHSLARGAAGLPSSPRPNPALQLMQRCFSSWPGSRSQKCQWEKDASYPASLLALHRAAAASASPFIIANAAA